MSDIDILEERCNVQETLIDKITTDLIRVNKAESLKVRKSQIKKILNYMEEYKFTGKVMIV